MADVLRVCVLAAVCACVYGGTLAGKGYFCRDPDTGKLHAANTTWPSETFCGNYTCRIKKKNEPNIEYKPGITVINITSEHIFDKQGKVHEDFKRLNPSLVPAVRIEDKTSTNIIDVLHKAVETETGVDRNKDGYLTDTEIKLISEILHTVKRSDLEAIVEIYHLAQNIYKEMDRVTTNEINDDATNFTPMPPENVVSNAMKNALNRRISYWYEPITNEAKPVDINHEGTQIIETTYKPIKEDPNYDSKATFFTGSLTPQDFGKLTYYYPMSHFQRIASYNHQPQSVLQTNPQPYMPSTSISQPCPLQNTLNSDKTPCDATTRPSNSRNHVNPYVNKYIQAQLINPFPSLNIPVYDLPSVNLPTLNLPSINASPVSTREVLSNGEETARNSEESSYVANTAELNERPAKKYSTSQRLLPFPYSYVNQYNLSQLTDLYYPKLHGGEIKPMEINQEPRKLAFSDPIDEVKDNYQNFESKSVEKMEKTFIDAIVDLNKPVEKEKPVWKTGPLAASLLKDIKAGISGKGNILKPYPFRNLIKLDKVGKVVKLNDLTRNKREVTTTEEDADKNGDFEAIIERVMCEPDTTPGFFKMGNLTQPYPACCPQRIQPR